MFNFKSLAALICVCGALPGHTADAPLPSVAALFSQELADAPGKEALMLTVEFPPGGADPVHRHDAHGFVYVLEGSIVMQVAGGSEVTLMPGQVFYEAPTDIHTVGRNASLTQPAKILVLLLKNTGVAPVLPVE